MQERNRLVGVIGRKGSGKSTAAGRLMRACSRLCLIDTMGEHSWAPNTQHSPEELRRFLAWADERRRWCTRVIPDDLDGEFPDLCELVYRQGDCWLGVEEIPSYVRAGWVPAPFEKIIRLGRHRAVSVLYTAQRAAEVARTLTAATDWFVLFSQTEPRDLEQIEYRCGKAIAAKVEQLGEHERLVWSAVKRAECSEREFFIDLQFSADAV